MEYTKGEWKQVLSPTGERSIIADKPDSLVVICTNVRHWNVPLIVAAPRLLEWIKAKADNGDNDAKYFLATLDF